MFPSSLRAPWQSKSNLAGLLAAVSGPPPRPACSPQRVNFRVASSSLNTTHIRREPTCSRTQRGADRCTVDGGSGGGGGTPTWEGSSVSPSAGYVRRRPTRGILQELDFPVDRPGTIHFVSCHPRDSSHVSPGGGAGNLVRPPPLPPPISVWVESGKVELQVYGKMPVSQTVNGDSPYEEMKGARTAASGQVWGEGSVTAVTYI